MSTTGESDQSEVHLAIEPAAEPNILDDLAVVWELKSAVGDAVNYEGVEPADAPALMQELLEIARQATAIANSLGRVGLGLLSEIEAIEAEKLAQERKVVLGSLTRREREVLTYLTRGLKNHDIGGKIGMRAGTVKAHTSAVYIKLGVVNRTQAAQKGMELGLAVADDEEFRIPLDVDEFTERQLEVLKLLASGDSNEVIAQKLGIDRRTITGHLAIVYDKLGIPGSGVNKRSQAAQAALYSGLLTEPEPDIREELARTFVQADELLVRAIEQTGVLATKLEVSEEPAA